MSSIILLNLLVSTIVFTTTCVDAVPENIEFGEKTVQPDNNIDLEDGLNETIEKILSVGPNLKAVITDIVEGDFLKQIEIGNKHPDINLNLVELLTKYGYSVEEYTVKTEDGYTIGLYRIPADGDPVLVAHGMLCSAVDFLSLGSEKALPYILANKGYDVWLINSRGVVEETLSHTNLSYKDEEFWEFSWDEIGRYDFATAIDFITHLTGKRAIKFVGHSQGTTALMVLLSERPEYNEKVSVAALLSPVAFMGHQRSPLLSVIAPEMGLIKSVANIVGVNGINRENKIIKFLRYKVCGNTLVASVLCSQIMYLFAGFDYPQFNVTNFGNVYAHSVGGSSLQALVHYAQGVNTEAFRQYDYGVLKNLEMYGSDTPPDYRLENVNTSLLFFHGSGNDWLAAPEDLDILYQKLPSHVAEKYRVPYELFCHTDYIWANDANTLVYDKIIELFAKY